MHRAAEEVAAANERGSTSCSRITLHDHVRPGLCELRRTCQYSQLEKNGREKNGEESGPVSSESRHHA